MQGKAQKQDQEHTQPEAGAECATGAEWGTGESQTKKNEENSSTTAPLPWASSPSHFLPTGVRNPSQATRGQKHTSKVHGYPEFNTISQASSLLIGSSCRMGFHGQCERGECGESFRLEDVGPAKCLKQTKPTGASAQ